MKNVTSKYFGITGKPYLWTIRIPLEFLNYEATPQFTAQATTKESTNSSKNSLFQETTFCILQQLLNNTNGHLDPESSNSGIHFLKLEAKKSLCEIEATKLDSKAVKKFDSNQTKKKLRRSKFETRAAAAKQDTCFYKNLQKTVCGKFGNFIICLSI